MLKNCGDQSKLVSSEIKFLNFCCWNKILTRTTKPHRIKSKTIHRIFGTTSSEDTLWNLYILVTMAQVPPLATPVVVVGAIPSTYTAFTV